MYYIGVDIGTSGVRAVAIDKNRKSHGSAAFRMDEFGKNHRDPNLWLLCMKKALETLFAQIDVSLIKAISVDGTSGTTLAVDGKGVPLVEPLLYNDPVNDVEILSAIAENAPKSSAVHGSNSALARAIKLQDVEGSKEIILQADWLSGQLSGIFNVSDYNNTLKTGFDPVNKEWPKWLSSTGLQMEKLPTVLAPGMPIGEAKGSLAKTLGLPQDVLIVSGTTDGCASFLATGADKIGDGVSVLGTTLTIKLLSDKPIFAPEYGIYSHRLPQGWLAGGASNSGGNVLEHFFSKTEIEELSNKINGLKSSGLKYYPLVKTGERFPYNDPNFAPQLEPRPIEDDKFLQGLLEGISDIEALGYQRLEELGAPRLNTIRSVGGGAKNPVWNTIRQENLKVEFLDVLSNEAAAGTAYLALLGAREAGLV